MFYCYISENLTEYINKGEKAADNLTFDYSKMSDAQQEVSIAFARTINNASQKIEELRKLLESNDDE